MFGKSGGGGCVCVSEWVNAERNSLKQFMVLEISLIFHSHSKNDQRLCDGCETLSKLMRTNERHKMSERESETENENTASSDTQWKLCTLKLYQWFWTERELNA